jgi:hypothetical protein
MNTLMFARVRAVVFKQVKGGFVGLRFQQVGARPIFNLVLNRLKFEFPLAECKRLEDGQVWWVISAAQLNELREFCRKNSLKLFEEIGGILHER